MYYIRIIVINIIQYKMFVYLWIVDIASNITLGILLVNKLIEDYDDEDTENLI